MTQHSSQNPPLHPIERAILSALLNFEEKSVDLEKLSRTSSLSIDQIRRGIEWLRAKKLIETTEIERELFSIGDEGRDAALSGLPERKLIALISAAGRKMDMGSASTALGQEYAVALGNSKKNGWVKVDGKNISITENSEIKGEEEIVLEKLSSKDSIPKDELSSQELNAIHSLQKRKSGFVLEKREKSVNLGLTAYGAVVARQSATTQIDKITPDLILSGEWKKYPLRPIDVSSPTTKVFPGRKHPMRLFMDEVRKAFISLGFTEISGPISQSALWNFDALFIPQQHSAREMQDTFYLSEIIANLKGFESEIRAIKSAHEEGGGTGSTGWKYNWSQEEAAKVVLRTHTTAVTISYLAEKKPEDARVFAVGRVFRNEKSNYKHNPEFYQIEGVMVGEKLNLRNLIFTISMFYSKLGFNEIKFWPTFFPYTEPSLQTMAFHKESGKWMELGGMGVFRPEVTIPLGIKNPVLAWGLSLDRLVMLKYGVDDIRQLFGANLGWLRDLPMVEKAN